MRIEIDTVDTRERRELRELPDGRLEEVRVNYKPETDPFRTDPFWIGAMRRSIRDVIRAHEED